MPTDKKIEIFDEEGNRIGYEPLLSEAEVTAYYQTRRIRNPENEKIYLYPPEILNQVVTQAHKDGKEFTMEMIVHSAPQPELSEVAENNAAETHASANTDEISNNEKKGGLEEIDLSLLESFPGHKFNTYEGQRLQDMVDSIQQFGILTPLIVWKDKEKYTIISGHNRKKAALLAGLSKAPAIVKQDISEEQARLIVGETNLRQRSFADMTHSERAFCLAEHYKLMKQQGVRNDIIEMMENPEISDDDADNQTSPKIEEKLNNSKRLGKDYGLNHAIVSKYIRIAEMHDSLLQLLDEKHIKFGAAYQLSFITDESSQKNIAEVIIGGQKVNEDDAKKLRGQYKKQKSLTVSDIVSILLKPQKQAKPIQLKPSFIKKHFNNGESRQEILDIIAAALDNYFAGKGEKT